MRKLRLRGFVFYRSGHHLMAWAQREERVRLHVLLAYMRTHFTAADIARKTGISVRPHPPCLWFEISDLPVIPAATARHFLSAT